MPSLCPLYALFMPRCDRAQILTADGCAMGLAYYHIKLNLSSICQAKNLIFWQFLAIFIDTYGKVQIF